jgi:hypothetical protein
MHQKCFNYALTNLFVVWFVQIHVNNDPLVTHLSPNLGAPTHRFYPKMLQTNEHTQLLLLPMSLLHIVPFCEGPKEKPEGFAK